MTDAQQDNGLIVAILERLTDQQIPRAIDIKEKVDAGGTLDDFDLEFLEDVFRDSEEIAPLYERHPELQEIGAKMISLYHDITERALANEQQADGHLDAV